MVRSALSSDGQSLKIRIEGRFDFTKHGEFRGAYEPHRGKVLRYLLDFGGVEYMDSSALGMLLMLREHAGGNRADVRLQNCSEPIKRILGVANFEKLFTIA